MQDDFMHGSSSRSQSMLKPMENYLAEPPIPSDFVKGCEGYLKYWNLKRSQGCKVAQMALDFLSAPGKHFRWCDLFSRSLIVGAASSVGSERAFSGGRLQANHLQHRMSAETFQAKMALGAWAVNDDQLLMPDIDQLSQLLPGSSKK